MLAASLAAVVLAAGAPAAHAADSAAAPRETLLGRAWTTSDGSIGTQFDDRIIDLVNHERAVRGLHPLRRTPCVNHHAVAWSRALVRDNRWQHSDLGQLQDDCAVGFAAENLAAFVGSTPATKVVRTWMGSAAHRSNLLARKARLIGVSVRWDGDRHAYYTVLDVAKHA